MIVAFSLCLSSFPAPSQEPLETTRINTWLEQTQMVQTQRAAYLCLLSVTPGNSFRHQVGSWAWLLKWKHLPGNNVSRESGRGVTKSWNRTKNIYINLQLRAIKPRAAWNFRYPATAQPLCDALLKPLHPKVRTLVFTKSQRSLHTSQLLSSHCPPTTPKRPLPSFLLR